MTTVKSSITDKPLSNKGADKDLLGIETYAKILTDFISNSDTPLTIGLQGEWGTGKTSLMNLIERELNSDKQICVWVNTWEYSLFTNKHIVTPSILSGVFDSLQSEIVEKSSKVDTEKIKRTFKRIGAFAANAAVTKLTGYNPEIRVDKEETDAITNIRKAKEELANLIENDIINNGKSSIESIVFFIDDLDRLDPVNAVEVLEAIKNLFDFEHCIFVLAIDYDVVVKGLESKFGPKTENNEREFRSFFDKIIQVPFSMPVDKYEIEGFLREKLNSLGIYINAQFMKDYQSIVAYTVGFVPRNIKRFINSYSLLIKILEAEKQAEEKEGTGEREGFSDELSMAVFALVGIQMSYPKIFRLLIRESNFINWGKASFQEQFNINQDIVISIKSEDFDEPWEAFLFRFCQKDLFLKSKAESISKVLNLLRLKLATIKGNNKNEFAPIIADAMKIAAITSVDDDIETKGEKYAKSDLESIDNLVDYLKENKNLSKDDNSILIIIKLHNELNKIYEARANYNVNYTKSTLSFKIGKRVFVQVFHGSKSKISVKLNYGSIVDKNKIEELYRTQNYKPFLSNDFQYLIDVNKQSQIDEDFYKLVENSLNYLK